ncbi:MAG TPA: hypothetical protein VHG34_05815, partial [Nitrososphaeraceae archaeon]|nr:hypothetical protein [Nitrososphaeraceae archaeon]
LNLTWQTMPLPLQILKIAQIQIDSLTYVNTTLNKSYVRVYSIIYLIKEEERSFLLLLIYLGWP